MVFRLSEMVMLVALSAVLTVTLSIFGALASTLNVPVLAELLMLLAASVTLKSQK